MVATTDREGTGERRLRQARDRAAPRYNAAAVLPDEVGRRMLERLDVVRLPDGPMLDAGCATGRLTRLLAQRYPRVPLVGVDPSPRMLASARDALPGLKRVLSGLAGTRPHWLAADVARLPIANGRLALVWSNLALHWLTDPAPAFSEFRRTLAPGGLLMFSTLGPDTLKELRAAFARVDDRAHVQRFPDMHDVGDALVHAGFADPVMDMETLTLTYLSVDALLRELRHLGSVNLAPARPDALTGRARWGRLLDAMEAFRRDDRIPATFEIVYGHAWKPEHGPERTEDGRAVVRVHRRARGA